MHIHLLHLIKLHFRYIQYLSVYPEVFEIENSKKCINLNSTLNTQKSRTNAVASKNNLKSKYK